jgi:hypothetical protein
MAVEQSIFQWLVGLWFSDITCAAVPLGIKNLPSFWGALEVTKMNLHISFPDTDRKPFNVDNEYKLRTVWEVMVTVWGNNGRVMWPIFVTRIANKLSPKSTVFWPMVTYTCYWVKDILVREQGEVEKESLESYCGGQPECSQFVYCKKKKRRMGEGIFLG